MKPYEYLPVGSKKFSSARYYSEEYLQDELEYLFKRMWLNVGHVCSMPNPGDYFIYDLYALGVSVLVVRDKDMTVRAFYNMCTHRGNKVVMAKQCQGSSKAFTCLFHGWTYDLQGKLVGIPGKEHFGDYNFSTHNLRPIHCGVWGGMIFINLAENPEHSLNDFMEPLTKNGLGSFLDGLQWKKAYAWGAEIETNWKLICDAQLEGYHVASLHGKSIAGAIPTDNIMPIVFKDTPAVLGRTTAYLDLENAKPTPLQILGAKFGASGTYVRSQVDNMKTAHPEAYNPEQRPDWQFDNIGILPMAVVFIQGNGYAVQRSWPITPGRTYFEMDVYALELPQNFGEVFNLGVNEYNLRDVITEDLGTLEHTQANLAKGPVQELLFNAQEGVLSEFHGRIDRIIAEKKSK